MKPSVRSVNLRIPVAELDELREEARVAHRSLHAHLLWILSRRHEIAAPDAYERARALAGRIEIEDLSRELRSLDRTN